MQIGSGVAPDYIVIGTGGAAEISAVAGALHRRRKTEAVRAEGLAVRDVQTEGRCRRDRWEFRV